MNFNRSYMIWFLGLVGLILLGASLLSLGDYVLFLCKSPIKTIAVVTNYEPGDGELGGAMWIKFVDSTGKDVATSVDPIPKQWTNVSARWIRNSNGTYTQIVTFPNNGTILYFSDENHYTVTWYVDVMYNPRNSKDARPAEFYLQSSVAGTLVGAILTLAVALYAHKNSSDR